MLPPSGRFLPDLGPLTWRVRASFRRQETQKAEERGGRLRPLRPAALPPQPQPQRTQEPSGSTEQCSRRRLATSSLDPTISPSPSMSPASGGGTIGYVNGHTSDLQHEACLCVRSRP